MNRTQCVLAYLLSSIPGVLTLQAQEVITPLMDNPRAAHQYRTFYSVQKSTSAALLELPFFDDFSNSTLFADTGSWSDAYAFVNNTFSIDPVTNGVATLDALDADGSIYSHAVLTPLTFVADHLTSQPVNLEYPASDSIYLSFLYQPGGLCDLPEEEDSLMVDFFATDSSEWINVWRITGGALHAFKNVMIPITDERFLTSGFRFRFRNRASLPRDNATPDKRSNVDYWHLDYIRLDRNRTAADTILRDVAFNTPLTTVFKNLTAVPWHHFESSYNTTFASFVAAGYRNNDSITRNVTRSLTILEPLHDESQPIGAPTAQDLPAFDETVVEFAFPFDLDYDRGDSALIRFKAALRTDEFDPKVNDTVIHDQLFKDYYAYDDGTAEAGYGLRGDGTANGLVAIRHYSYEPDMLGGVYLFFNQVYDSLNLKEYVFNLMVWNDSEGGGPGSVLWDDETIYSPRYTSTYTGFVKYEFSEPVPVSGTFYIGWRQYKPYILNVGLDLNNVPDDPVMFYNLGSWSSSEAPGMLLLRPFIYDSSTGMGRERRTESLPLNIYPNPATDRIWFDIPDNQGDAIPVDIYDTSGRQLHHSVLRTNSLDVSGFSPGLYYIRAIIGGEPCFSKVLINP
jgi:hypothetical protein